MKLGGRHEYQYRASHKYQPVMTIEDLQAFMKREFPQLGEAFEIVTVDEGSATMRLHADAQHLRPGGTVSGPSLFALADVAAYAAILAHIGPVALAVTTNLNINFLRKPSPGTVEAVAHLLKLGKRLAVLDISLTDGANGELVAHATATYSIPPR
ncbi:MAG TPA: PaaI family thioesterase [Brucella melitensis]|nr:PaaI family thioesterase [Brucella melitensis]HAJ66627.1 PaaI family thioesterase [Brucella melitensis]HAK20189.1 PaaI family thioesterase [Brucella melitensis]HCZ29598.1 PaaI family thioesterase [Brucella melitensis]